MNFISMASSFDDCLHSMNARACGEARQERLEVGGTPPEDGFGRDGIARERNERVDKKVFIYLETRICSMEHDYPSFCRADGTAAAARAEAPCGRGARPQCEEHVASRGPEGRRSRVYPGSRFVRRERASGVVPQGAGTRLWEPAVRGVLRMSLRRSHTAWGAVTEELPAGEP